MTYIPDGLPQYGAEGAGPTDVVFQYWANGKSTIDITAFDKVVNAASAVGMKLIVTLTNNWADYGGMDVYTVNLGGKYHDDVSNARLPQSECMTDLAKFYRLPQIKAAYKHYVKTFVTRYKNNPTIFAWELINEARCDGTSPRNLPRSANCTPALLTSWYDEMSTYIKSLDSNHLVTTGSEGMFDQESSDDGFYNGSDGGDFDAALGLKNIDFATFHTYPDWWSKTPAWATQWIKDHGTSMRSSNKPVLHEEYGELLDVFSHSHSNGY